MKMYVILVPDCEYGYPIIAVNKVFKTYKKADIYAKRSGRFNAGINLVTGKKEYDYYEIEEVGYYG